MWLYVTAIIAAVVLIAWLLERRAAAAAKDATGCGCIDMGGAIPPEKDGKS